MPDRPKNFSGLAPAPAADDFEILDGPTQGVRKISATARAHARNALAPRGGVALDGTADKRVWAPISSQVLDSTSYSINIVHKVRSSPPSAISQGIFILSAGAPLTTGAGTVWAEIDPSGNLNIRENNASAGSTTPIAIANFVGIYGGITIMLTLVRAPAGWTLYLNGVSVGTSTSALGDTVANGAFGFGAGGAGTSVVGTYYSATLYNLALSAADVLEILELGGAVPDRFKWGSQIANYTSNFSTGADGWGGAIGDETITGNVDGIGGVNDTLKVLMNTTGARGTAKTFVLTRYKAYRVKCDAYMPSTNVGKTLGVDDGISAFTEAGGGTTKTLAGDTWTATTWTLVNNPTIHVGIRRLATGGAADELYLKNISFTQVGAILHLPLDDGGGYQLRDLSSNALHGMMTPSGVMHVAPGVGPFRFRARTSASGSEQLQLATALPANAQILRVRARVQSGSGTPTISLGTTSGGAQVVASIGLTNAWKLLPLALPGGQVGAADISLWATSNTGDVIEWDIAWEPQSF